MMWNIFHLLVVFISMNTNIAVLTIFKMVLRREKFNTNDLVKITGCSKRTCFRYIKDIKQFVKDNTRYELHYSAKLKSFVLIEAKPKTK